MAITGVQASAIVEHTLAGSPVGRTAIEIANDAGELLLSYEWNWADGSMALLDFQAGQSYVELPPGFKKIISVDHTLGSQAWFQWTSHAQLSKLRALATIAGPPYYGVVVHDQAANGAPSARIELFPTPGSDEVGALQIFYERGWVEFPEPPDTTPATLPKWMEYAYIELLKAVSRGYEDDLGSPAAASGYIADVIAGPIWRAALNRDAIMQPTVGTPENGLLGGHYGSFKPVSDVLDPP